MKNGSYAPEVNERRRVKQTKQKSHNWVGDKATYVTIHWWLGKYHKKTGTCKHCKKTRPTEWALKKGKKHARRKTHYKELCRSCHRKYDEVQKRGWVTRKTK